MKKYLTITVAIAYFLLMSVLGILAATPGKVSKASKTNFQKEVTRNIACPGFTTKDNKPNEVRAMVEVDENGKVNVTAIQSSSKELKEYVAEQLKNMTIKNVSNPEAFVLLIRFVAK